MQTSGTCLVKRKLHIQRPDGVSQHAGLSLVLDDLQLLLEQSLYNEGR